MFLDAKEKDDERARKRIPRGRLPFAPATTKLTLGSLDVPTFEVIAQYNPKELQLDREIPWSDPTPVPGKPKDVDSLEFSHTPARTLSIEMMFDSYEKPERAEWLVEQQLQNLEKLATVRDPSSRDEDRRRPHHCVLSWGVGIRPIRCVIVGLSVKILMFACDGIALRAVATVKLKETHAVNRKKGDRGGGKPSPTR